MEFSEIELEFLEYVSNNYSPSNEEVFEHIIQELDTRMDK